MSNETLALNLQEASVELKMSQNTLYTLCKNGKIPHIKLSRKYLFSRLELEKWLAGQSNQPPAAGTVAN